MSHVLDTNAVSALMRGDEQVVARLERLSARGTFVPEPVWAEIAYGLARLPPSARRARLETRARALREELRTAPWTPEVSAAFGRLKAELDRRGRRLEDFDLAIAAHALAMQAVLVSADGRHLARVEGLELEDWSTG